MKVRTTREHVPAWAAALLGWIVGAGVLEWRGSRWWAPPLPPVCGVEPAGPAGQLRGEQRPPGPRELRRIAGVGQVRAVAVARYLLERSAPGAGSPGPLTLPDLTGISGVGPVIGGRLLASLARREPPFRPGGPYRPRSRLSD